MPVLVAVSVLGVAFVSYFFLRLCREPRCRTKYEVWYIRGLIRRNLQAKHTAATLRRVA